LTEENVVREVISFGAFLNPMYNKHQKKLGARERINLFSQISRTDQTSKLKKEIRKNCFPIFLIIVAPKNFTKIKINEDK